MPSVSFGLSLRGQLNNPIYSPSNLFASSEPGAWYDPSDLTTLFQDSAGTTPVTAAGQPVGKMLDKSGRGNHATQSTAGSRPIYQTSGGKSYLVFDGIDDFMVTPTITPGSDKVQVFAGIRKLSDAATGTVADINGAATTNFFMLRAPAAASNTFGWYSGGTSFVAMLPSGYPAPVTKVLTGIGDIAAPVAYLRINGVQVATSSTTQGTGAYGNYPIYIGRRGGTTLPFNGNLYGLIVRYGPNLTTSQIANTEVWLNGKTEAY